MNELKQILRQRAEQQFGAIRPCGKKSFDECYTVFRDRLQFWFNTPDDNTHIVQEPLSTPAAE
jgi:hypothetical protein